MPRRLIIVRLLVALATLVIFCFCRLESVFAMNLNLAMPYGDTCSPPQTPDLVFYSPQSEDMLFEPSMLSKRRPSIEIDCQAGLRSVGMTWTLHRNMIHKPFREGHGDALPGNRFRILISPSGLPAGFYDVRVSLDTGMPQAPKSKDVRPVSGVCGFGWRPEDMAVRESRPADFKAFWEKAKLEMRNTALDAREETPMQSFDREQIDAYNLQGACLPADYDPAGHKVEAVESCKISFAGPDGGRVYAWLAKPIGPGPFPAMLVLPGAGFAARPRPLEHARHGYLTIDMQVHGQDVDLEKYPQLPGYSSDCQYDPPESYYYYKVHQRVMQAVNYLVSRPDVDASRIAAVGGSQGGRLGIVIAGLDPRIKAVVSCIANSPNYPHLTWVAHCNSSQPMQDGMDLAGSPPLATGPDGRCLAYYDPMNYAPDIHCPVMMNSGMIDPVSPPFSVWAVYLRLGTRNKTLVPLPGLAHDWSAEFDRRAWRWLDRVMPVSRAGL